MTNFKITLTRAQLRAALIFSADRDIRYYLSGVCLHVGDCGDARLVATDGHRLAVLSVGDHPGAQPGEYIIPREAIKQIKRASRSKPETVDIEIEAQHAPSEVPVGRVLIKSGVDIIADAALIDGKFPDWQRVIPEPSRISGEPATYNAFYLGDIAAALVELGDKFPAVELMHNGTSAGLAIYPQYGLMIVVMPMRGSGFTPADSARAHFLPRRRPVAVVETATGGQAFPCDPAQDVSDKRARAVAAHCSADVAAWLDPSGALQAAGLMVASGEDKTVTPSGEDDAPRAIVNSYEARQEARRARYAELSDKMRGASAMHYSASRKAVEHIPFGQPILVGHHSERGHRATLARARRAMDRSCEAARKAEHYAERAASVGSGGISSDDPAALVKLRAELAQCERLQEHMKATNKAIRLNKTPEARAAALVALGLSETEAAQALKPDFMGRVGFPDYRLKNNGANARRIAARIAELETRRQGDDVERNGNGYTYREDIDENRVMFEFPSKPADAVREILKGAGFKWSPSRCAWVRQLNNAGRWHGEDAAHRIDALSATPESVTPSGEATESADTLPEAVQASGEDKTPTPSGEADRTPEQCVQMVTRRDGSGREWLALAHIPKGCIDQYPLQYGALGVAETRAAKLRAAGIAATVRGRGPYMIEIDPSGEVAAEPPCATLLPGRWIPSGAENAERIAFDAELGAEVWLEPSRRNQGACAVIAYSGKRTKHDAWYTMRDRAQALQWACEYMGKLQASAQAKAARLAEKKAKRAAGHKLQVGDVLRSSWGYDQTNIDYYEVTRLIGRSMVEIRKIAAESVGDGYMTGQCVPTPGRYIGEPMKKAVSDYDGQSVRISSYASAHKIEPTTAGGVKCYPVDHWTAYA